MRQINYLSPSSISVWEDNPEKFYAQYLADNRQEREPQLQVMSVGSAFDAYAKSYLHHALFGHYGADGEFALDTIFEAQVEPHNRDWARTAGEHCFTEYKESGALADLMLELGKAKNDPRFESSIEGEVDGIPLLGKPDAIFETSEGLVILDWKVNGYCSKRPVSPKAGYVKMWTGSSSVMHKDCQPMVHRGVTINVGKRFESVDETWARQLAIYGWLGGAPIGDAFVVMIDQLACDASLGDISIRTASHRGVISPDFQNNLMATARKIWETINSDHIFHELSPEVSKQRCLALDNIGVREPIDQDERFLFQ